MMKNRRWLKIMQLAAVCVLLVGAPAGFAAQVPDTGDPNEPVCNPHSYTDLGNGIIKDKVTGLMWQQATAPGTYDWQDALEYCENLQLANYTDWRLPTILELSTLVDSSIASPGPTIDTTYFPGAGSSYYWSSTPLAEQPDGAWAVGFATGFIYHAYDSSETSSVRAVRGEPVTGSFVDNGDGTITDTSTGLMWVKSYEHTSYSWEAAKAYCENLTFAGNSDWRLPTRNELQSIVDYTHANPSINATFFPNTAGANHWTSTTNVNNTSNAWGINFYNGNVFYDYPKTGSYYVRPVRAGPCGLPGKTCPAKQVLGAHNPQLENLRAFRDSNLAQSAVGRKIIEIYYANADSVNAALDRSPALRAVARRVLEVIAPMVGKKSTTTRIAGGLISP
jgi:hypothetical protein